MKINDEIEAWREKAMQMRIPFMCNGKDVTEHWECYQLEREEIDAAVALMRRHDDRLTRLREWLRRGGVTLSASPKEVQYVLDDRQSTIAKIDELLTETKETD